MTTDIIPANTPLEIVDRSLIPDLFRGKSSKADSRFGEYFTARIRNPNTRIAYFRAARRLSAWCVKRGVDIERLNPSIIALYIEELQKELSVPSVKLHLSAIRMLFDYLLVGGVVSYNPASAVKAPKYSTTTGKTPILSASETRSLLDSIDVTTVSGLRNRALISVMVFSVARVSAAVSMNVEDYFSESGQKKLRLHEKGGKLHTVPAHHLVIEHIDAYIERAGIKAEPKKPLFREFTPGRTMTDDAMSRAAALQMVKLVAKKAGLDPTTCCHTFRGTGITIALDNGATLEEAQRLANHAEIKTTMLYDRRDKTVRKGVVEKIII